MEWIFASAAIIAVLFCAVVITDKIIFDKKLARIESGMTGKQVQQSANIKLKIIRIEQNMYYARISSPFSIFKYQLIFRDGKLLQKHRI